MDQVSGWEVLLGGSFLKPRTQKAAQTGFGRGQDDDTVWGSEALQPPHFALSLACFSGEPGFAFTYPQPP